MIEFATKLFDDSTKELPNTNIITDIQGQLYPILSSVITGFLSLVLLLLIGLAIWHTIGYARTSDHQVRAEKKTHLITIGILIGVNVALVGIGIAVSVTLANKATALVNNSPKELLNLVRL
ncbi:Mbov_0395 family pilin-like conjugal transfer protein [Mycoplasma crocodyli]|uniref:Transmembrane protein n=1 Tax=Mycoplasma crocodyli (strain ATCC 51981 / MP145) TaxID=512564 RepID=D5E5Q0_MYCCM|nr:hypothetical protein [Mycoplasma crocodyli]ADE19463.1 hypothetical protein MCRO_0467 [Mycoplasma crocodyli MP145]